jgi:hypothetical protein
MNAPVQTVEARELALAGMGASRLRKEDARFIQGKGNYVDDIKMPGMLHMDIVRSPLAHARIKSIDKSAALAIPGVHAVQEGFYKEHGLQCGFCTPGMLVRAQRLLQDNPNPTEEEIRAGMSGNLCRCTGYQNIVKAVQYAAAKLRQAQPVAA